MTSTRRLTARGALRRNELITAATELFATKGYHPTSVSEIVSTIGVGKGVFYWYFESKEQLFMEVLKAAQHDIRRRQNEAIDRGADPLQQISAAIKASVHWAAEHKSLVTLFEFAATDANFARLIQVGRSQLARDAMVPLGRAVASGQIALGEPEQLAHAILGVTTNLVTVYIYQRGADPSDIANLAADFCLRGIGAREINPV